MNSSTPAIVSQAGARPLSRWALLLICIAYLLPGQLQREPWRHEELSAFGFMSALARGDSAWWLPSLGGLPAPDGALLPYWLGAAAIKLLPWVDAGLAARLPFIALLAGVLALCWYATFHLARTEAAQPVAFAFGGEAHAVDYARALADGALLALMASLGLILIGHESSSALVQLFGVSLWLYALAVTPFRERRAQSLVALALTVLALSGAPFVALLLGSAGLLICHYSRFAEARRLRPSLALGMLLSLGISAWTQGLSWRIGLPEGGSLVRLLAWFVWPSAALAAWTLWRWRGHWRSRHLSVPLGLSAVGLVACVCMGGYDRALLLALPGLAVLASFALPTLQRGVSAMLDWFSLFFFSALSFAIWAYFLALHTPWLPRMLEKVRQQAPAFQPGLDLWALALASLGSLAWLSLVRWRTSRQRAALWRSLVLPAGGVVLAWLLAMTLWRPAIDHAMGHRSLLGQLRSVLPATANCIAAPRQNLSLLATLEAQGGWKVDGRTSLSQSNCDWAVLRLPREAQPDLPSAWRPAHLLTRAAERGSRYWVLRRSVEQSAP
ncbi:hypothetical protein HNQ51_001448 [Inhella inkyongensis]|uniref:4-amino-4-deoxy-L-arabinose transferase-like glycosyltransferase n=1 Tax=Inhella inkyongensis TaxID=392593 RepID=A0A840S1J4_9BURK|nr:hypothetical protein [Inhella inkyongensis]MBB5204155.1 hypothetical protein [Inhella inkyongensis]